MIDKNPKDAIKLDLVVLDKSQTYSEEKMLTEDGLYRYLYQPAEQHEGQKKQASDFFWNKNWYRFNQIVDN